MSERGTQSADHAASPTQMRSETWTQSPALVYDGKCPFCSRYVRYLRLQNLVGELRLIDARRDSGAPEIDEIRRRGLSIDEGMVLKLDGAYYHGADCIHRLALLSTPSDVFNRVNRFIFRSRTCSMVLYPALRAGRNLLLRLLGQDKIGF